MDRTIRWAPAVLLLLCCRPAWGHFGILLPQVSSAERDKPVSFLYQWGHPFEHELFNTEKPEGLVVVAPDGTRTDLGNGLTRRTVKTPEGKEVTAYGFAYTPTQRGDH